MAHRLGLLLLLLPRAASLSAPTPTTATATAGGRAPLRLPPLGPPDRPLSWSNPTGAALTPIRPGVWLAERPFYPTLPGLGGTDVGCKMAVVRLADGALWVHSPVALDAALRAALDALGPVRFVVTPNAEHMKWAADWIRAYPDATSYACPNLAAARPDVGFDEALDAVNAGGAPRAWGGEFDACYVDAERNPFTGKPFFNEVVFCHRPSRTLFCTDLYWNYPAGAADLPSDAAGCPPPPLASRLWKWGMDAIYRPFYGRLMVQRPLWDARMATVLGWEWDYIAHCHGEPVARDAKRALARHLDVPLPRPLPPPPPSPSPQP